MRVRGSSRCFVSGPRRVLGPKPYPTLVPRNRVAETRWTVSGQVRQVSERLRPYVRNVEVAGSSPVTSTTSHQDFYL
jgi:hypothetical protein